MVVYSKPQLEARLHAEKRDISEGHLKEDNPLDVSENFRRLLEACRRGDIKVCQEMINEGVNINAVDTFDYSPLILASLCGHYEVVQLLLESGALCERDTFQGERCLYNALNDRIRNLLLQYDYSKSANPLQPLASHLVSLLSRLEPATSDITIRTAAESFHLHKFVLSARSPYFRAKLADSPETTLWKLPYTIPPQAFEVVIRYLYLGEIPVDLGTVPGPIVPEEDIFAGIDKLSRHLEIQGLCEGILNGEDRRLARQRRTDEVQRGRDQLEAWFTDNVLKYKVNVETTKAQDIRWDRDNGIFADVLLRADEDLEVDKEEEQPWSTAHPPVRKTLGPLNGIPVGPVSQSRSPSRARRSRISTLYPVHRAMLIRSDFFLAMFNSTFREAQQTKHLQIISIDCSPAVLEVVLEFMYSEKADIPLELAVDVLFAADLLLIEKLKIKAAVVISTLGSDSATAQPLTGAREIRSSEHVAAEESKGIDIYDVIRAAWLTRVHRLEEFGAKYLADRLEDYIDDEEFAELIRESAERIKQRQEIDSIELLDDIRYYLSERFRLRFEDSGIDEMLDEDANGVPTESPQDLNGPATDIRGPANQDEGVDVASSERLTEGIQLLNSPGGHGLSGAVRTLDGEIAGEEFATDALKYEILLGKIDSLLDRLKLDA